MTSTKRTATWGAVLALLAQVVPATTAIAAEPVTQTFIDTASEQPFVVPDGVTSVHVVLVGGRGGHYSGLTDGGYGARVEGDLAVTPGATLYVDVGAGGADVAQVDTNAAFNGGGQGGECIGNGFWGAGGGGASDIRVTPRAQPGTLASRLVVAGGGGGAGDVANGGDAGSPGAGPRAGGAATSAAGGAGGVADVNGGAGSIGTGGDGASSTGACAGGGGGGLFGGGGGGALLDDPAEGGGSGGGGSSYTGPLTNASVTTDTTGISVVEITYTPVIDRVTVGAEVDVRDSAACLLLSVTQVSFGTLSLGDENRAAGPEIMVKNCSGNTVDVLASGTAATGPGASWSLVDSAETCGDTLGLDRYRLALHSPLEFAAPLSLSTDPKAMTTLPSDFVSTQTARIFMACPGSTGGGVTMSMSINYLAVEQ